MKYLKLFEVYNKQVGNIHKEDGWMIMELGNPEELNMMLDRFYLDKKWIGSDGDWEIYYLDTTEQDQDGEDFWHHKTVIYTDPKHYIIKTKELISEPVYKVRDPNLTMEQELALRNWIGTVKTPRISQYEGKYLGIQNGLAKFISPHTGKTLSIEKDGEVII